MNADAHFKAPWGPPLVIVTSLSFVLFCGVAVLGIIGGLTDDPAIPLFVTLPSILLLALVAHGYYIRGFTVTPDALVVRRFARDISFPLSQLQSVDIDPTAMRRTCPMPNGGLFSFGGPGCRNKKLGKYIAYAADFKRCVVLRFANRTVVVTPDSPERFVGAIEDAQPNIRLVSSEAASSAPPNESSP